MRYYLKFKAFIKPSFALCAAIFIFGCGSSENLTKQREFEDRENLIENLSPLTGTYRGMMENRPDGSDPFPIELNIFLVEEEFGINEDGETQFRPALRARYRRADLLNEGVGERSLKIRYYWESSEIAGTSSSNNFGNSIPESQFLSFTGFAKPGELDLEFRDQRGILGSALLLRGQGT